MKKDTRGFTLLIAIVMTAMLLLVSVVIVNIALKQLIIAYTGQQSQHSFYAADSGVDCALFWDTKNPSGFSSFDITPVGSPGVINVSLSKSASQSSTISIAPGGDASHAVDGNTDGNYYSGSVSHTNNQSANDWWQVDLGQSYTVSTINIWNRTDCCSANLTNYWVFVSDTPFGASDSPAVLSGRANTWSSHQTTQPNPSTAIAVPNVSGRYVRVQLSSAGYLALAEVSVMGATGAIVPAGSITCNGQTVTTGSQTVSTVPSQSSRIGGGGSSNPTSIFQVNFSNGCAIVQVTKQNSGTTVINSRGYNICSGSGRRFERGITITY